MRASAVFQSYFDANYHSDSVMSHDVPADVVCLLSPSDKQPDNK